MPSITRRKLLGGIAVGGAASYTGYRFLPAKFVPTPLLEQRTKRRSVPKVDTSLPVAPEAVESSRQQLRKVVSRAEEAWNAVDDSDVESEREEFDRSLESSLEVGREQLAETEGADPTTEVLKNLRYGVNRAAWSLAAARAITEDYDTETLQGQSKALQRDVNDFANAVSYEVADPRTGLAFLYRTERALHFARLKADNVPGGNSGGDSSGNSSGDSGGNSGDDSGGNPNERDLDHSAVVDAIRSGIEGKRWLGDARAIYDSHRSNVADAGASSDLESHLDRTWQNFAERIDSLLLDREEAVDRYFPDDAEEGESAREWATQELFTNGYSGADDAYPLSFGTRKGLLAFVTVEHAKALQHAEGFTSSMERLDATFSDSGGSSGNGSGGNGGVGMPIAARTKQQAIGRLRDLLADSDDPITRELASRPREEITFGDWSLGVNPTFESKYPYAEAYAAYLLAAENLGHTPDVLDSLVP